MIIPYNPRASAKIIININPTNILSCWPNALTPASPAIPIAKPAARELNPQHNPLDRCPNPVMYVYLLPSSTVFGVF